MCYFDQKSHRNQSWNSEMRARMYATTTHDVTGDKLTSLFTNIIQHKQ